MSITEIIKRYPVTNYTWDWWGVGATSAHSFDFYIIKASRGVEIENYDVPNFVGIREYFVRHSVDDDNFGSGSSYNNVDPWYRPFKAYKRGNGLNRVNRYMCRPMVKKNSGGVILMYVLTTSIEGHMIYCLDVISSKCGI